MAIDLGKVDVKLPVTRFGIGMTRIMRSTDPCGEFEDSNHIFFHYTLAKLM
jgi:hypothetical protein